MKQILPFLALATLVEAVAVPALAQQPTTRQLIPGQLAPGAVIRSMARSVAPVLPQSRTLAAWNQLTGLSQSRSQHAAVALNGKIYAWGGYVGDFNGSTSEFSSMEIYNVATNTWSTGANYPYASRGFAGVVGPGGLIYSLGDGTASSSAYRYDPATNVWTAIASLPVGVWESAAVTANGKIYLFGGWAGGNGASTQTQIYTPSTNSWTTGAPMPIGRHGHVAIADAAGLIHIIGGTNSTDGGNTALTSHLVYNAMTNTWTTAAALPVGINQAGGALGADGRLYVVGGKESYYNGATPMFATVYVYTPSTNSWSAGTSLPLPLSETRTVAIGNDLYTVAGTSGPASSTVGTQRNVLYRTTVTNSYAWTGATSTAWAVASNWSGGVVPTAGDDVTIPGGLARYPVVSTTTAAARNVTVNPGATLTVGDGATLAIAGDFDNDGTFAANGNATVTLTGTAAQSVGGSSPTQFRNLTVGASGATLTGRTEIQRLLTLTGTLNTNGQRFLILSNYIGTGMVVNNGGTVSGNATVQRYIAPAGNAGFGYRHWTPAVNGATLATLAVFPSLPAADSAGPIRINAAYNSAANPGLVTPFPTIFGYSENRVSAASTSLASFDQGWQSPTATNQVIAPTTGYTINEPAGNFFEVTGSSLNTGNITRSGLTRGAASEAGWHLIGNPYPAPVDWNLVGRTNVDAAAYVYHSNDRYSGGYTAYVNGVGTNNLLPMGQAFFVRVSSAGASGSVSFTNAARLTTYAEPTYSRPATTETRPLLQLTLQRQGAAGANSQDALYVYQQAGATPAFDAPYDALKVQLNGGQQPTLYQQAGPDALAIQGVPTGNQPLVMPLGLNAPVAGTYLFTPEQLINFPAADQIMLEDRQTGTWHDLRQGAYAAQLPQGLSTTRFVLHFNAARPLANTKNTWAGELQVYPNPTAGAPLNVAAAGLRGKTAQVRLLSAVGQVVRASSAPLTSSEMRLTLPTAGLAAGLYTLQLSTEAGTITRKITVQ
ncbi:kelch repeat-containing protein [Hymenobacter sp. CRA2]|uniref:kelch repeat-containing protein n=1 Tax=Hymenobacter sp. CRA2 TaxID=1955620 RepID=UPI00098F7FDA|nr:kelch repeat-containing protein [Hymenobacter sp. CRA2]OON67778.1 hypothetical protein B0919_16420 [Hymenobacter sp. CRA2]